MKKMRTQEKQAPVRACKREEPVISDEIAGDYEKILSIGVGFAYITNYTRKL